MTDLALKPLQKSLDPSGVLGHSQANTTYRYVNANTETAKRAAAALDAFNAETPQSAPRQNWCTKGKALLNFDSE